MRWLVCTIAVLASWHCGGEKKKPQTDPQATYDYRTATQNFNIGINYLNNGDIHNAIQHLQTAVNLDGNSYRFHHGLGLALSLNGQLEEAEAQLKQAITIFPDHSESHNVLGSIYISQGRYDEALTSLKKVIQDNSYPQPHFPYFNLGLCKKAQNREDEAVAAFNQSVRLKTDFYRGYVALAEIYKEKGDYQTALKNFQLAEPGYSNDVRILYEIGFSFFKLRKFDEAKAYLAQVSILFPPPDIDKPTQEMLQYIAKAQR